jgi:hypothetical protein
VEPAALIIRRMIINTIITHVRADKVELDVLGPIRFENKLAINDQIKNTTAATATTGVTTAIMLAAKPSFLPDSSDMLALQNAIVVI